MRVNNCPLLAEVFPHSHPSQNKLRDRQKPMVLDEILYSHSLFSAEHLGWLNLMYSSVLSGWKDGLGIKSTC